MDDDSAEIELCGPFEVVDRNGSTYQATSLRIFDEGYGVIDVYVHFDAASAVTGREHDPIFVDHIVAQLRRQGYVGPNFMPADAALQDEHLIVLEAPEAFSVFAKTRGWINLAESFDDNDAAVDAAVKQHSSDLFAALMRKFNTR